MSEIKNFNNDLEVGQEGERLFKESNAWRLFFPTETDIKETNMEEQHRKGDFITIPNNHNIEVKTRKPNYSYLCGEDIVIELSNTQDGKELFEAWFNKYSKETYLFYQWTEIVNKELKIMRPIVVFKPYDLKEHLPWIKKHKIKSSPNKNYNTNFIIIKLK